MPKRTLLGDSVNKHFQRIIDAAEACATEGLFPDPDSADEDNIDCERCPGRESCLSYWDDSVVALPMSKKSVDKHLPEIRWHLEYFKMGKLKWTKRRGLLSRLVVLLRHIVSREYKEE